MIIIKKSLICIVLFGMLIGFCGCGNTGSSTVNDSGVFQSNKTAAEYIEGYWTDSKGNYLIAQSSSDGVAAYYIFSMPTTEDATMYLLDNGTLLATHIDENNVAIKEPVLSFEYIDDNTFNAKSLINNETYILSRDSMEPDTERLDDEYVFKTMSHASPFLNGYWTDSNDNYVEMTVEDDGNVGWGTNLSFPECDYIDFYDGNFVGVTTKENGEKIITPALSFKIKDKDHIIVKSLTEDFEDEFLRDSARDENIDEYAFWNVSSTLSYLYGSWKNDDGKYFNIKIGEDGNVSWETNIPEKKYNNYQFGRGRIYTLDKDGNEIDVLTFKSNGMDEVMITSGEETYVLSREKEK